MKVIQVPFGFYPDPVGGTEVYVKALSRHLQEQGIEVLIAAPAETNQTYHYNQLPVQRFATSQTTNIRELYGLGDELAALEFDRILEQEQPDIVHLHAFTRAVSLRLVQAAKQRHIPVVFTYHTPTVSCQRGTLLQWGTQVCDGKINVNTCARCTLQGLGMKPIAANVMGSLPLWVGQTLGALNLQGGIWTAAQMTELMSDRQTTFHTLMETVNHIVAVCNWVKDVLVRNQVPPEKITVIRQGLCHDSSPQALNLTPKQPDTNLKLVFLGRLDPTKGIHILIQAIRSDPQLAVSLDIYGVSQGGNAYQNELLALVNDDPRITFKSPLPSEQVISTLAEYDLLAVPSQWLETGPMVILEAFAAGIPVIGSNLGGIAELVQHKINGILVEPESVAAWYQELNKLSQKVQLAQLQIGINSPLSMHAIATQMLLIYSSIRNAKTLDSANSSTSLKGYL
ncbi:glycosyltransferase [Egbenema bharatensis]|uniref:glycosyltransferase n=1 Tax=Egbenema bharatensis TaxID=3463334 RepID=UPI003A856143